MSNIKCDKKKCIGCLACVYACKDAHNPGDYEKAVTRRSYEASAAKDTGIVSYKTKSCMHCKKAKCMDVCPADAISIDEYGFVQIDFATCFGCRHCEDACPFNAIDFQPGCGSVAVIDAYPYKCDGCVDRIKNGQEPACVSACPVKALSLASTVK